MGDELSVEERNLLSVAYKNAVGSRRAAWRIITSVEQKEKSKGNEDNAKFAKEYCTKVEAELDKICNTILGVLDTNLVPKCSQDESKVFYLKMKADYYRYNKNRGMYDDSITLLRRRAKMSSGNSKAVAMYDDSTNLSPARAAARWGALVRNLRVPYLRPSAGAHG